jgi:hypothetical protein
MHCALGIRLAWIEGLLPFSRFQFAVLFQGMSKSTDRWLISPIPRVDTCRAAITRMVNLNPPVRSGHVQLLHLWLI